MPTIAVVNGFAIRVNIVEDGEGPHVHVIKGGREYRVLLLRDGARLMTMGGREKPTHAEARRAVHIVEENLSICWTEWRKWHE
jgi:hypothetical protein